MGRSGGLAIFWRSGVKFHLRAVSRLYIDGDVEEEDGSVWRLTGFYGEPQTDQKELSWSAFANAECSECDEEEAVAVLGGFQ